MALSKENQLGIYLKDRRDPAPVWPDTQAVADWALMNSRGERILRPE